MSPTDLTVEILKEIRGVRTGQDRLASELTGLRADTNRRFEEMNERFSARFEVLETELRGLGAILARGVQVAIDYRRATDDKLDDHEHRIRDLERRSG